MRCFGAPNAEASVRESAGEDAARGTAFHEIMSMCVDFGLEPDQFAGSTVEADGFTFVVDDDMVRFARAGLARVRELAEGCDLFVETWVDLEPWLGPGEGGTLDIGIVNLRDREITVFDWKYGSGVPVSPIGNEQLRLYALGLWRKTGMFAFRDVPHEEIKVRIIIEQPRHAGGGGEWVTSVSELLRFGERAKTAVAISRDPKAPRLAGEVQCKFCKAKAKCAEFARFNLDLMGSKFEDLDDAIKMGVPPPLVDVDDITPEQRSHIVQHADMIASWIEHLHAATLLDALAGRPTPGLKAVVGQKGKRTYTDSNAARTFLINKLGNAGLKIEPISPTQAEKKLPADDYQELAKFVTRAPGKPVLVPVSDARDPIQNHADKFDNLGEA
jgi:hypothetical protein